MRALANEPMPMWWPSISTVVVPSGDAAVTVPRPPGQHVGLLEELEHARGELELLGDAGHGELAPHVDLVEGTVSGAV